MVFAIIAEVEMRYKPERALTLIFLKHLLYRFNMVEMRYKPERALKLLRLFGVLLRISVTTQAHEGIETVHP